VQWSLEGPKVGMNATEGHGPWEATPRLQSRFQGAILDRDSKDIQPEGFQAGTFGMMPVSRHLTLVSMLQEHQKSLEGCVNWDCQVQTLGSGSTGRGGPRSVSDKFPEDADTVGLGTPG
jgi:hypothetical protein